MYPLSFLASHTKKDVLYYHQAMKADDSIQFKEVILKEIDSFKKDKIFTLILSKDKP